MIPSFNLVDQPWIPCLGPDGRREELGLLETLARAHEIREIRDGSPLVTVSLHRLLLAVLHRNFGPESLDAWAKLWQAGRFDADVLEAYFARWRDRFDLWSSQHPFYQSAGMETANPLPATCLLEECAVGHNKTLFDHSVDSACAGLSSAAASRGLVARQAISIGFGKSPDCVINGQKITTGYRSDAPMTRGLSILVVGENLFETLLCSLTHYGDDPRGDRPAWETDSPEALMAQQHPNGRVDLYTWQSRRVRLILGEDTGSPPTVRAIHFAQGRVLDSIVFDPMKPHKRLRDAWVVFSVCPGRAIWRDSGTLLQMVGQDGKPACALDWTARAVVQGLLPPERTDTLAAFGISTEKGKAGSVVLWRHETMPLPAAYLRDAELVDILGSAIAATEQAATALQSALGSLVVAQLGLHKKLNLDLNDKQIIRNRLDGYAARYWAMIETPFRELLLGLPGDEEHLDACLVQWQQAVCRAARAVFDQVTIGMDGSVRLLQLIYQDHGKQWGARKTLNIKLAAVTAGPAADDKETPDESQGAQESVD